MADITSDPQWKLEVSGFYGPGAYLAWLLVMASIPVSLVSRRSEPTPTWRFPPADIIAAVLYPVVAAGDAALRLADSSINWDHMEARCPLFEAGIDRVEGFTTNPYRPKLEPYSQEFLSQCVGLQLALEVAHFFQGLSYFFVPVALFWILRRQPDMPRHGRAVLVSIVVIPPLWCLSVGIGAIIRVKSSGSAVLFFLLSVTALCKIFFLLLLVGVPLFISSMLVLSCIFLIWAWLEARAMSKRPRGASRREGIETLLFFLFFGTMPMPFLLWVATWWWFPQQFMTIIFLDDVVGISLSELDQITAACGGLITFMYAAFSAGGLHWLRGAPYRLIRHATVTYDRGSKVQSRRK